LPGAVLKHTLTFNPDGIDASTLYYSGVEMAHDWLTIDMTNITNITQYMTDVPYRLDINTRSTYVTGNGPEVAEAARTPFEVDQNPHHGLFMNIESSPSPLCPPFLFSFYRRAARAQHCTHTHNLSSVFFPSRSVLVPFSCYDGESDGVLSAALLASGLLKLACIGGI
jgi:hypothetical protein